MRQQPAQLVRGHAEAGANSITDRDGDGMPDAWELANQLDPDNAADAAFDPTATDAPTSRNSVPAPIAKCCERLQIYFRYRTGQRIRLQFPVVAGRSYTVQRQDGLAGSAWSKLQDFQPWQPTVWPS